jgi:putative YphP/YqiW family bacilliredoxin
LFSVFAGQDKDATERARSYFAGYPPSSPSIALLRDGKVVHMMHRSDIEHREAVDIAAELKGVFDKFCVKPAPVG